VVENCCGRRLFTLRFVVNVACVCHPFRLALVLFVPSWQSSPLFYRGIVRIKLRFYVPLDTKQIISETFFPASLLVYTGKKLNLTQEKQTQEQNDKKAHKKKSKISEKNLNQQSCVCISLCTAVIRSTLQDSSDNFSSYSLDSQHLGVVYWRGKACLL